MKKVIQVSIPRPCGEQWSSFSPTKQGGFCQGCQKEVIDFTQWSDDRIKAYFKALPNKTCGRFRSEQLRVYTFRNHRRSHMGGWLPVLLAGIVYLFTSKQTAAQLKTRPDTEQLQLPPEASYTTGVTPTPRVHLVGTVKSAEDNMVLPGVNVLRKGTTQGTVTDVQGVFTLDLDHPAMTETLVFSFIGLQTVEYVVNSHYAPKEIIINMESDILGGIVLGGVSTRRISMRRFWWKVKRLF